MKKIVSLSISLGILFLIYSKIDSASILPLLKNSRGFWLFLGFFMFIPTTLTIAVRFKMLAKNMLILSVSESLKLVLAASSMNMVLPSKMGDIAKGYFIAKKSKRDMSEILSLVVYEKVCDMLSLMFLCVVGILFFREYNIFIFIISMVILLGFFFGMLMIGSHGFYTLFFKVSLKLSPTILSSKIEKFYASWQEMCRFLSQNQALKFRVALISLLIWLMHLLQIWFFIRMLNAYVPLLTHLMLTPISLFSGLLPFSFAGVGVRDAALIYFFDGYLPASTSAALGILCTLRYIVPAVCGLPFLNQYMTGLKKKT